MLCSYYYSFVPPFVKLRFQALLQFQKFPHLSANNIQKSVIETKKFLDNSPTRRRRQFVTRRKSSVTWMKTLKIQLRAVFTSLNSMTPQGFPTGRMLTVNTESVLNMAPLRALTSLTKKFSELELGIGLFSMATDVVTRVWPPWKLTVTALMIKIQLQENQLQLQVQWIVKFFSIDYLIRSFVESNALQQQHP